MQNLTAKEIKKVLYGVVLSIGEVDVHKQKFELFVNSKEYAEYIHNVLTNITGIKSNIKLKMNGGYKVITKPHSYMKNLGDKCYNGIKTLTHYNVSRLNAESLAHMWMLSGDIHLNIDRSRNTCQNIGYLNLSKYPQSEIQILIDSLDNKFDIKTKFHSGKVKFTGENLLRFIDLIQPYILNCFKYKTYCYYKTDKSYAELNLSSAKQFIRIYNDIDDIVRYSLKDEETIHG